MKKIVIALLLLNSIYFYAQPPGGGNGRRSPQNQQRGGEEREVKAFKASDVAGIIYYDIDNVFKKIKIKNNKTKISVKESLKHYNSKIKEISFLNSDKFNDLDKLVNSMRNSNSKPLNSNVEGAENNRSGGVNIRQKVRKILRPIREKVNQEERILNESLENVLNEKQFKKWLKYQKKEKESIQPKRPNRDSNRQQPQNQNRQRRF
jgi:hypothetical protein